MAPKKLATTLTKKKSAQGALLKLQGATEQAVQVAAAQGRPTGQYVMEAANLLADQREEFSAAEADLKRSNNPLKKITHKTSQRFDKIVDVSEQESRRVMTLSQEETTKCECSVRNHLIKVLSNQNDTLQGKRSHRTGRQKVIKYMTSLFTRLIRQVYIQQRPRAPKWTNLTDASAEEKKKREKQQRQVHYQVTLSQIQELEEEEKKKEREREDSKRDGSNLPGTSELILHFNTVDRINAIDIERERLLALPPPPPRHATMVPMKGDNETVPSEDYHNRWSIDCPSEESVGHGSMHSMVSNASSRTAGSGVSKLSHHDAGSILRSSSESAYAAHHPPPTPPVPPKPRYQGQAMIATSGQSSSASDAYHHPALPAHNNSGASHSMNNCPASSSGLYYYSSGGPPVAQPAWSSSASAYAVHQPPVIPVPSKPRYHGQATIATSAQSSSASDAYRHPDHSSSIVSQSMSTGPASSSGLYSSSSGAAPFAQPPWVTSAQGNPTRGNSSAQSNQSFSQQQKYKPQTLPPNSHPETGFGNLTTRFALFENWSMCLSKKQQLAQLELTLGIQPDKSLTSMKVTQSSLGKTCIRSMSPMALHLDLLFIAIS
ncbi:hypothetical protein BU17DRAFT_99397 [Hysterangium stoloniferum]|nr:hypothetical protein BU17DRAFT_99397 [Hysterangium stoloniferum]